MIVHIKRQKKDGKPFWQDFIYDGEMHRTVAYVLDYLNYRDDLYDKDGNKADRIQWECSCGQALCGACGMVINKRPALACETFIDKLKLKSDTLVIEPLSKFPVEEDLIVDKSVMFENYKKTELWLLNAANKDTSRQKLEYECSRCLKCGLCLEVCPNYSKGQEYFGPALVPEAFVTLCQSGEKNISKSIDRHFGSGCSKSEACIHVCPLHIDILSADSFCK